MKENFPSLAKEIDFPGSLGSSEGPKEVGLKEAHTKTHHKSPKIKDKERILKAERKKETVTKEFPSNYQLISQKKPCRQKGLERSI